MHEQYVAQVRLLLSTLPEIARESVFALKGGTAINLFYRDMPRLSVDIDLIYLPVRDRESSLRDIDEAFGRIATAIAARRPRIAARRIAGGGESETRIMVSDGRSRVKVETSPVMRGAMRSARPMLASPAVTEQFGFVEMNVLAFEDLYGGKLHAAHDRQHPRDLFDVKLLYDNEGLTEELFRVFLVYVASSGRPMHELLAPATRFSEAWYGEEFAGMTREAVSRDALVEARRRLHDQLFHLLAASLGDQLVAPQRCEHPGVAEHPCDQRREGWRDGGGIGAGGVGARSRSVSRTDSAAGTACRSAAVLTSSHSESEKRMPLVLRASPCFSAAWPPFSVSGASVGVTFGLLGVSEFGSGGRCLRGKAGRGSFWFSYQIGVRKAIRIGAEGGFYGVGWLDRAWKWGRSSDD